jgi:hypothetical protein
MSRITDYKVIQADGNRALAEEVKRFVDEGWEPWGSVILVGTKGPITLPGEPHVEPVRIYAQPIVKREAEHEELSRLREMERLIGQLDYETDHMKGTLSDAAMVAYVQELLAMALRGGRYEREGG